MSIGFKIDGVQDIEKALKSVPKSLSRKVVFDSLKTGAKVMQVAAKASAPKRTGRLRKAIKIKRSKILTKRYKGEYGIYLTVYRGKSRDDRSGAYYGRFINDGTARIRGRKFMNRAYRNKAALSSKLIVKSIERGIAVITKRKGLGNGR